MPTHDRRKKDKKNSFLKAAKNCVKVLDLYKNQVQITNLVIENGEQLSSLCSIRNTSHDTDVDHMNIISNNNNNNNINNDNHNGEDNISQDVDFNDFSHFISHKTLSNSDKYTALKCVFKIEDCYVFPKDNSKRKFLLNWLNVYEWLVYS